MSSDLERSVESLLFAAQAPLSRGAIRQILEDVEQAQLGEVIQRLKETYNRPDRGIHLVEVAGGYQFRTNPACATEVRRLLARRPARFSRAALEVLAVVAYRQPVTRSEVDAIRRVDSSGVLRGLLDRKLLRHAGRSPEPGRPYLLATTKEFLETFGLKELGALPSLREFREVARELAAEGAIDPSTPGLEAVVEEERGDENEGEEGLGEEGSEGEGKG